MFRKLTWPACALALMVGVSACELDTINVNQPDRARALAGPDDVETLIASSFIKVYEIGHYWDNPNFAFNHMSNRHSATWGNMAMNDLGREPREALPNTPSFRWAYVFEAQWADAYSGISGASEGIRTINNGLQIGPDGERNQRALTFAKANQGILTCLLGLWYDQAFLIDENTNFEDEQVASTYDVVLADGISKLNEAITMARSNSFTLEASWINGTEWSNNEFADYLVSWKARCRANAPRTNAEAATVDWTSVIADSRDGIREVQILTEDRSSDSPWWDGLKIRMQENDTWHRMHMDWVGMADVSGEYQDWLGFPTEQRTARKMSFGDDIRFPANNVNAELGKPVGTSGAVHRYNATIIFRAERGTYRQSHYGDARYDDYTHSCSGCEFGLVPTMTVDEFDGYIAEGMYRGNDFAGAAAMINVTRTAAGLPPAPSDATSLVPGTGGPGGSCIPKKRYDIQGRCGNLQDAMFFEHFENVFNVYGGLEHWHGRRNEILPSGTPTHLPMPAADLEVLELAIYTWGGDPGAPGSAPSIIPGNLNASLERVAFALGRLQDDREVMRRVKTDRTIH